jgi:hypothetical protein
VHLQRVWVPRARALRLFLRYSCRTRDAEKSTQCNRDRTCSQDHHNETKPSKWYTRQNPLLANYPIAQHKTISRTGYLQADETHQPKHNTHPVLSSSPNDDPRPILVLPLRLSPHPIVVLLIDLALPIPVDHAGAEQLAPLPLPVRHAGRVLQQREIVGACLTSAACAAACGPGLLAHSQTQKSPAPWTALVRTSMSLKTTPMRPK